MSYRRPMGRTKRLCLSPIKPARFLLIGVDDRTQNVRGVAARLNEQQRLTNPISDRTTPIT